MSLAKAYKPAHGGYPGTTPKVPRPGARIEVITDGAVGFHVFSAGQRGTIREKSGAGWVVDVNNTVQWLEPEDFRLV